MFLLKSELALLEARLNGIKEELWIQTRQRPGDAGEKLLAGQNTYNQKYCLKGLPQMLVEIGADHTKMYQHIYRQADSVQDMTLKKAGYRG